MPLAEGRNLSLPTPTKGGIEVITMHCDACGGEIPQNVNGGARLKLGNREYVFHLCQQDRDKLRDLVNDFLDASPWQEKGGGGE